MKSNYRIELMNIFIKFSAWYHFKRKSIDAVPDEAKDFDSIFRGFLQNA